MDNKDDRNIRREQQRRFDIERLRGIEQEAVHRGSKLGLRDRLKAAFHLTRAWNQANQAGRRKEDFQNDILERLQRPHGKREVFRLTNWTLRRGEDPTTQPDLIEKYKHPITKKDSPTPQKALEPYLVGIAIAAEYCEANPDTWKLDMVRELSVWSRPVRSPDIALPDDRPAETLEILLRALCAELAQRNRLDETFKAISCMGCRWEMFGEHLVATDELCMQPVKSLTSQVYEDTPYFEEMFPYPSVPLLRVPYFVGKAVFMVAPEAGLRPLDGEHLASGKYWSVGTAIKGHGDRHYCIPADAPGVEFPHGDLVWYREVRLCIAPDGHGGYTSVLETRPYIEVRFCNTHAYGGRHHVQAGYEIDLERGLFYGRDIDGGPVWPHVRMANGAAWRITLPKLPEGNLPFSEWTERNSDTTGWNFEADPVLHSGEASEEPWYLSYTPASAPYLRHWLTKDWSLRGEPEECTWDRGKFDWDDPGGRWHRNLPPIHELNFPDFSHATSLECSLHNGLIKEALQASIDRLKGQATRLQAEWHAARDRHSNALLRRWKTETEKMDAQE